MLQPFPTEQNWERCNLNHYGLIAIDAAGSAKNLEKSRYAALQQMLRNKTLSIEGGFGISLGSFSLSYPMTMALLDLFQHELQQKNGKLDSDTHFWMAMTWDCCMQIDAGHHARMQHFKRDFHLQHPDLDLFGVVDIGAGSYWWDYGTVKNYYINNLKLTQQDDEGQAMRHLLGLSSTLVDCKIKSGNIVNSVLVGVQADHLDVRDCIIINSRFSTLVAQQCLLYNVQEQQSLTLRENTVRADVWIDQRHAPFYTTLDSDGKVNWDRRLPGNPLSYAELFRYAEHV